MLTGYFGTYGADTPSLADRELEIVRALGTAASVSGKPLLVHTMVDGNAATEEMAARVGPDLPGDRRHGPRARARVSDWPRPDASSATRHNAPTSSMRAIWEHRNFWPTAGIRFPGSVPVRRRDDLAVATARLTPPYVLKAAWLEHKSEVGGVRVNLRRRRRTGRRVRRHARRPG